MNSSSARHKPSQRPQRVLVVVGTRPEAIKMAPVIRELGKHPLAFETIVCATAQHREMLDQALEVFDIAPDIDLDLMESNQSLARLNARVLERFEAVIETTKPDWVLVQGDTTTAMAAALTAFYKRVKIGHVEAGLRTDDRSQPFPEEINRRIIDQLSTLYFAPTERNRQRLLREGVAPEAVTVTGNTVIDALLRTARNLDRCDAVEPVCLNGNSRAILVTAHRRENHGNPLRDICRAIHELARNYQDDVHVIFPTHLNPAVSSIIYEMLNDVGNVSLIEPVDYVTLVGLLKRSTLVLTDSGGLQEEAPSLDVPVLVLRNVTEREEVVEAGAARLVGTDPATIVTEAARILDNDSEHAAMAKVRNPYGDGNASKRIVRALLTWESLAKNGVESMAETGGDEDPPI